MWEQILGIIDKLTPSLLALIGVYLGWALNSRSQKKLTQLELLESTFNSFREVRSLVDNIPPDLDEAALIEKLRDDKFKKNLRDGINSVIWIKNRINSVSSCALR